MNSALILFHIGLYARERQVKLAAQLALLNQKREEHTRRALERVTDSDSQPPTLDAARAFFSQPGANLVAVYNGEELRQMDDEIARIKALVLAGGCDVEELAVMLESLCLADDFAGVVRNSLNQLCVLVRASAGAIPEVLGMTFPVSEELLAVVGAYRLTDAEAA